MAVAQLLRPQGRRGELLAEPSAPFEVFTSGKGFVLCAAPSSSAVPTLLLNSVELESAWQPAGRNAGRFVLKLKGTDSITAAEAIAGHHLFMRVEDLPTLEEGTYRVRDLVGCSLFDCSLLNADALLGTVLDLQFPVAADGRTRLQDAPDLLVVQPLPPILPPLVDPVEPGMTSTLKADRELEPVLVPFVRDWLVEVDLPGKRLRMRIPPGLFDAAE